MSKTPQSLNSVLLGNASGVQLEALNGSESSPAVDGTQSIVATAPSRPPAEVSATSTPSHHLVSSHQIASESPSVTLTEALLHSSSAESFIPSQSNISVSSSCGLVIQVQPTSDSTQLSSAAVEGPATVHITDIPPVQEEVSTGLYPIHGVQQGEFRNPRCGPKKAYETEFKLQAVEFYKQGHSKMETAKCFNVHPRRIREWISMEEVLKVTPRDRKRVTKRLLTKLNVSEDMWTDVKKQMCKKREKISEDLNSVVILSNSSANSDLSPWAYNPSSTSQISQLHPLADLTTPSVQLSSTQGDTAVLTDTINPSDTAQIDEVETTPTSALLNTPEKQNIDSLRLLSKSQVQDLLSAMNLTKYKDDFAAEQVDGEILSSLGERELIELGVTIGLHRIRFMKIIQGKHSAQEVLRHFKGS